MVYPQIRSAAPVSIRELCPSSSYFKEGASLRILGKLREYSVETAVALVADRGVTLKIDTQHLRDLSFRIGSIYQFIGELHIERGNEAILHARTGRNMDGIDLQLYRKSIQHLRKFLRKQDRIIIIDSD